jgi:hypothetical protein
MPLDIVVPLTQRELAAVQFIAASSTISTRRDTFGVTREDLRRVLGMSRDEDLSSFVDKANVVLANQVIPGKVLFDEVLDRFVFLARVSQRHLPSKRFPPRVLLVYMYLYYFQVVAGRQSTTLMQLLELVSSDTQGPRRNMKAALESLVDFAIVKYDTDPLGDDESYRLTGLGREFMSAHLLQHTTELVMDRNFSHEIIVDFFRLNRVRRSAC